VVGLVRDLLFGPVVMFGLGGIYTEALKDVAFAVAPVSEDDAYELMDQIEAKVLLGPVRGEQPVDRAALAKIIMAVGQMAEDHPRSARSTSIPCSSTGPRRWRWMPS